MKPTTGFAAFIRAAWGNPAKVADVAFGELFRHGDNVCLDHDDQVSYAKQIGVLAGGMKDASPETFIAAFEEKVLNG